MASPRLLAKGVDHCLPPVLVAPVDVVDHLLAPEHLNARCDNCRCSLAIHLRLLNNLPLIIVDRTIHLYIGADCSFGQMDGEFEARRS